MRPWIVLTLVLLTASGWVAAVEVIHVPADVSTIAAAILAVPDGGVIEIAPGTYSSPSGGWQILNPARSFTMRAGAATVVLDGGGTRPVLRYLVDNPSLRGAVVFEDLVIANGQSQSDGTVGGITLYRAEMTFLGCTFTDNNGDSPTTGGGAVGVFDGSKAVFDDCSWIDNRATNGGGAMRMGEGSEAWVNHSQVVGNRSNFSGHRPSSSAGGFDVNNASLWVANTRFEANQTGYAGGAIYSIGEWQAPWATPRSLVVVANCTFDGNLAEPAAGVTPPGPTEGGAIHMEDQAHLMVVNSRFLFNDADLGGGISLYRAVADIDNSVFIGNRAVDIGSGTGFGGAIKVASDDGPEDGTTNYPSGGLTVRDSYIQGRSQSVETVAQVAGGIFVTGDVRRTYGLAGSPVIGTPASNRAPATVERTIFADCDVDSGGVAAQGIGGALSMSLVDFAMDEALIIGSDAVGSNSSGGALWMLNESTTQVDNTTFARNTANLFGAAVYATGTEFNLDDCQLFDNEISPGVSESEGQSYGAAIFSAPTESAFPGIDLEVSGVVASSVFSLNIGMPIFDDDRNPSPVNAVQYNANTFHNSTFSDKIYRHSMVGSKTVSELNSLVIGHSGVDKATINNQWNSSAPVLGAIRAAPTAILPTTAAGDPASTTEAYLGYAWSGGSASLDGSTVSGGIGYGATVIGLHTLDVEGQPFTATVDAGVAPAASLTASPVFIPGGGTADLIWTTTSGQFLAGYLDHGIGALAMASGSVAVSPTATTTYTLFVVTEEGGVVTSATVWVDEVPGVIFIDGFESGNTNEWN
jgi:predicted outer membrane repeat protein